MRIDVLIARHDAQEVFRVEDTLHLVYNGKRSNGLSAHRLICGRYHGESIMLPQTSILDVIRRAEHDVLVRREMYNNCYELVVRHELVIGAAVAPLLDGIPNGNGAVVWEPCDPSREWVVDTDLASLLGIDILWCSHPTGMDECPYCMDV